MGGKKSNKVRRDLRLFKAVRTWQLLLILIPLTFLAATLLRFDHLRMVELRKAVIEADAAGGDENIEIALEELKEYVFNHIVVNISESNGIQSIIFGTGPFYLEQQYYRAANAAIAEVEGSLASDGNPNGNIYAAVAAICQPQAIANGWQWTSPGYLECWTSELAKYPTSDQLDPNIIAAKIPPTELYRREYASPVWAPTPAGFVLLACLILAIIIVVRLVIWVILKISLIFLKRF